MRDEDADRGRVAAALAAVVGVGAADVITGQQLGSRGGQRGASFAAPRPPGGRGIHVLESTTVNRSPEECYAFWRDLQNLPRFMTHVESVQVIDQRLSHWVARAPAGARVEWDAEIAVGMEGHLPGVAGAYDGVKQAAIMQSDRPPALRQAIMACRNGGTVSVIGVYGGLLSKVPFGAVVNKGLTIKAGQTPVHRYLRPLLERIERGEIDPTFVITHRVALDDVPEAYHAFGEKEDGVVKVVVKP